MRHAALVGGMAVAVGVIGATVHPLASLALVAGFVAVFLILGDSVNAALAFVVALVMRPTELFPVLTPAQPVKVLALVAIVSWFITSLFRGDRHLSKAPHGKWMLALVAGVFLSVLMSTNPGASSQLFADVFVKLLLLYVLLVQLLTTKRSQAKLQFTLATCTVILAFYAIFLKATGLASIEGNRAGFVGMLGDPNDLALVLLMYIPLLAELALGGRGFARTLSWFGLAMLIIGIFATVSRGGALGLATVLVVGFFDRGPRRLRLFLVPTITAAVLALLVVAGLNERNSGAVRGAGIDESAQNRLDSWEAGLRMVKAHPISGVGFGEFAPNYPAYAHGALVWKPMEAHNSFLQVFAETGIVGFVPFLALVILSFRVAYRLRKLDVPSESAVERALRRSLLPALAGFCVSASLLSQAWSWFFLIMIAQAASMYGIWSAELNAAEARGGERTDKSTHQNNPPQTIGQEKWKAHAQ